MIENKTSQENYVKSDKPGHNANRTPLQDLSHENNSKIIQGPNPLHVKYYSNEIYLFLTSTQENFQAKSDYLNKHTELNNVARAFLIDWVVKLHGKFRMLQETLYISVNLIDRYLEKRTVTKKQLQLVGLTAIFIAAKYEEIYPPMMKEYLVAGDQAYSKQHLIKMEIDMLKAVEFQITFPTSWRFIEKMIDSGRNLEGKLAEYILELGLIEYSMLRFKPSVQAYAAVFIADAITNRSNGRNLEGNPEETQECIRSLSKIFKAACNHPLISVREKYLKKKLDILKFEADFVNNSVLAV